MNLSIIIPVFNAEKYISKCLNSILFQNKTNLDVEIIVVNDGSVDRSLSILEDFKAIYKNIIISSDTNKGTSTARNRGIEIAQGDYIWFIDADDFIEADSFQILEKEVLSNNFDVLTFDYFLVDSEGRKKSQAANYDGSLTVEEYLRNEKGLYLWKNIYKRNIISDNKIKFIDGIKNIEDFHFNILFFNYASKIKYMASILYNYSFSPNSTSRDLSKSNLLKLADDSEIVHVNLYFFLNSETCNRKKLIQFLLDKSVTGFFYSLFRFNYNLEELKGFYGKYKENNLIPLNLKNVTYKMLFFSKIINSKKVFFYISTIKKRNI